MKFFDRVNLIGRVLIGFYVVYHGIWWMLDSSHLFTSTAEKYTQYFLSFWKVVGGIALALGIKPRATAAVLLLVLFIEIFAHLTFFLSTSLVPAILYLIKHTCIIGALLFIAGTRNIPYGLLIRSEESMNEKYGKQEK